VRDNDVGVVITASDDAIVAPIAVDVDVDVDVATGVDDVVTVGR
jgi:hypothetical protein